MISPRWLKIVRDLWTNKTRTLLVLAATTLSIFALSAVLTAFAILTREIEVNYINTQPASAALITRSIDPSLLSVIRQRPEIQEAEARQTLRGRVQVGQNEWRTLLLFVIADIADLRINTFMVENSETDAPQDGEIWIERSTAQFLSADMDSALTLELPDGSRPTLIVSGIVHDPGQSSSWMDAVAYGYISQDNLTALGVMPTLSELRVQFKDAASETEIESRAQQLAVWLESQSQSVTRIEIPPPGAHPHQGQMNALLVLLLVFSVMALLLSGILVSNMIAAFLAQQTRQIGIMKTIGARTGQIVSIYLGQILVLTLIALVIGMAVGTAAGQSGAALAAGLLNFNITSAAVPVWVYLLQAVVGISVPVVVASIPILRSSRITVLQAINDFGIDQTTFGSGDFDGILMRLPQISRPTLLSIRNTFRKTGRLVLTLTTLAVSGAIFMAALNVLAGWNLTLDSAFAVRNYDIEVRLQSAVPALELTERLNTLSGIQRVETWQSAAAARSHEGEIDVTHAYPGGVHGGFSLIGLPVETNLIKLDVVAGRWLEAADTDAIVINRALLRDERDLMVGQSAALTVNGQITQWTVVGIVDEIGFPAAAYTTLDAFSAATNAQGMTNNVRVVIDDTTPSPNISAAIEAALAEANIQVASTLQTADLRTAFDEHITILLTALFAIALLTALVGGLGLTSTMSINVLERIREFGVMRTIGARSQAVLTIVLTEGLVTGILSWMLAVVISIPLTLLVSQIAGQVGLGASLNFAVAPQAVFAWLGIVAVLGTLASSAPASSALRLTVHEVLAYQ